MTDEEEVIKRTEAILNDAMGDIKQKSRDDKREALLRGEASAWLSDPLNGKTVYDVWVYDVEFQGTTETLAAWQETDPLPTVATAFVSKNMEANSCLSISRAFGASKTTPNDVKELLSEPAFYYGMFASPAYKDPRGLMVRTQAFASEVKGVRPSEADDKVDVVVSCCLLYDVMAIFSREEKTGKQLADPLWIDVIAYDGNNHKDVKKCSDWLAETYGEVASLTYMAINTPLVIQDRDPEMWEAVKQDLLARKNQQSEQE